MCLTNIRQQFYNSTQQQQQQRKSFDWVNKKYV